MLTAMPGRDETLQLMAGGSAAESIGGAAAVVLAILGLIGVLPYLAAPISTIAIGAALAIEGGSIGARYQRVLTRAAGGELGRTALLSSISAEFLGGVAGIALGILALVGVRPLILLASAAIVFGVALVLGSGITARLDMMRGAWPDMSEGYQRAAYEAVRSAAGAQILVGLGSAVLGILALIGFDPMTLTLVALLAVGAAILITGLALSGRMAIALRR